MTAMWGIHNDQPNLRPIEEGFVSIGWDKLGDLSALGDRDAVKAAVADEYPDYKSGAIPVVAGTLLRFRDEVQTGDIVVYPNRADSTVNIARVTSAYFFDASADVHRSRRRVQWLRTGMPRENFSQPALYEIGSSVTLFRIRNHANEFQTVVDTGQLSPITADGVQTPEDAVVQVETEPDADRISEHTKDFVLRTLNRLEPVDFEHFTAGVLTAMGYRTRVTAKSGDGGVDVIAHRDSLGVEAPILKVQCKKYLTTTIGRPEVQELLGTLAGEREAAVFVTLSEYTKEAQSQARSRHDLRLINGAELVALALEHYDRLDTRWKSLLPLRQVFVVDEVPAPV